MNEIQFKNFEIEKKGNKIDFDAVNMKTSMANALRRTILGEIKNVGFLHNEEHGTINVIKNTTGLHNEFLSHRISMLALKPSEFSIEATLPMYSFDTINTSEENDENDENNYQKNYELSKYKFVLNVSQKDQTWITSDDFKVFKEDTLIVSEKNKFFPIDPFSKMPSIISRFPVEKSGAVPEELHIECFPTIMYGNEYTGFSPTCVSVTYPIDNGIHFTIEGIGTIRPKDIVHMGLKALIYKIDNSLKEIEHIQKNLEDGLIDSIPDMDYRIKVEPVNDSLFSGIDYYFHNETHTLGNMLQDWIYSSEIIKSNSRLEHVSYFEPHPLSKCIVLRMVLKTDTKKIELTFEDYFKKINVILKEHLTTLHHKFTVIKKLWVDQL
jgi:DNA-directed RNA polymerase subunit L